MSRHLSYILATILLTILYLTSCNKPDDYPKMCAVELNIALIDEATGENLSDLYPDLYPKDSIYIRHINGNYHINEYSLINDTIIFHGLTSNIEKRFGIERYIIHYTFTQQDTIERKLYGDNYKNKKIAYYLNNILLDSISSPCGNYDYYLVIKK